MITDCLGFTPQKQDIGLMLALDSKHGEQTMSPTPIESSQKICMYVRN